MIKMTLIKRINVLLVGALVLAGGPLSAQFSAPTMVRLDEAQIRLLSSSTMVPGTVVSRHDAKVAAEVDGRLMMVLDVGTEVSENDAVARIEDTPMRLRQEELAAEVARAEARLQFLVNEERRFAQLAENNLAAVTQLEQTRADMGVAKGDLGVARARLAQNEDQLSRTIVRAPFAGVVVERLQMPGEHVTDGARVVRIVDPGYLEVIARASLSFYPFVKPGQSLSLAAGPQSAEGVVRTVVAVGDEDTHQFELRLDLDSLVFPVGQTVRVRVPTSDPKDVLVVHRDALVLRPEGMTVFVMEPDQSVRQVGVGTGIGSGDFIEILGAIQAGDRVVVRGNERLRAGQTVNVIED